MSNKAHYEFQEKMRLLLASFAEELPDRMNAIEVMWNKLQTKWTPKDLQELHRSVYNLADTGRVLGFLGLSIEARGLEQLLKSLMQKEVSADTLQSTGISQHILELKRIVVEKNPILAKDIIPAVINEDILFLSSVHSSNLIFVVNDDVEAAQELALQLRYYGYEVEVFNHLNKFQAAIMNNSNAIVLMDIEFPEDKLGGIHVMKDIQRDMARLVRVIFISSHDDLICRLEAVRAGSVAYFTKPINSTELIDQLDLITASQIQESFRVLIVDDNPMVLCYHAAILEQAEMSVKAISDPMKILETLLEFNPDLILMDLHMSACSGIELAKVIRQMDGFSNTPIVYLASEDDFNTQSEAMSLCGDNFLVKPIEPEQLVASVSSRVTRARSLRSLMVHDGLTSLLNHTAIREEFVREVVRSNRLNSPLSFAMVDIDFFKKVNDTYGHAAGDRVIKSLGRLLKQRLRETDIVGRYGGEEFAIIMNDTDATSAAKVIDEIRNVFSRLLHLNQDEEFSVTFSCGIADLAHFSDATSLSEASEKALYQAKQRGRNKVVVNTGD